MPIEAHTSLKISKDYFQTFISTLYHKIEIFLIILWTVFWVEHSKICFITFIFMVMAKQILDHCNNQNLMYEIRGMGWGGGREEEWSLGDKCCCLDADVSITSTHLTHHILTGCSKHCTKRPGLSRMNEKVLFVLKRHCFSRWSRLQ